MGEKLNLLTQNDFQIKWIPKVHLTIYHLFLNDQTLDFLTKLF